MVFFLRTVIYTHTWFGCHLFLAWWKMKKNKQGFGQLGIDRPGLAMRYAMLPIAFSNAQSDSTSMIIKLAFTILPERTPTKMAGRWISLLITRVQERTWL